jgi:hypothetical protein
MKPEIDLYEQLSNILGRTVTANTTDGLTDEEWETLPAESKNALAQLLDVAMHYPSLVFPEGAGVGRVNPASLPEPNLPSWDELIKQEQDAEDADSRATGHTDAAVEADALKDGNSRIGSYSPDLIGLDFGLWLNPYETEEFDPNFNSAVVHATFFDVPGIGAVTFHATTQ